MCVCVCVCVCVREYVQIFFSHFCFTFDSETTLFKNLALKKNTSKPLRLWAWSLVGGTCGVMTFGFFVVSLFYPSFDATNVHLAFFLQFQSYSPMSSLMTWIWRELHAPFDCLRTSSRPKQSAGASDSNQGIREPRPVSVLVSLVMIDWDCLWLTENIFQTKAI